jgi:hypothetical protein
VVTDASWVFWDWWISRTFCGLLILIQSAKRHRNIFPLNNILLLLFHLPRKRTKNNQQNRNPKLKLKLKLKQKQRLTLPKHPLNLNLPLPLKTNPPNLNLPNISRLLLYSRSINNIWWMDQLLYSSIWICS